MTVNISHCIVGFPDFEFPRSSRKPVKARKQVIYRFTNNAVLPAKIISTNCSLNQHRGWLSSNLCVRFGRAWLKLRKILYSVGVSVVKLGFDKSFLKFLSTGEQNYSCHSAQYTPVAGLLKFLFKINLVQFLSSFYV